MKTVNWKFKISQFKLLKPNPSTLTSNNGFSLMELTIFMGLFSIILVVLTSLFTALVEQQTTIESTSSVESDSKYILARLSYDIQRADSITTPSTAGSTSNTLILNIDGNSLTYSLSGNNLVLQTVTDSNQLNSPDNTVNSLNFQRLGNSGGKPTITVSMNIVSTIERPQGAETKTIRTTIGLR